MRETSMQGSLAGRRPGGRVKRRFREAVELAGVRLEGAKHDVRWR